MKTVWVMLFVGVAMLVLSCGKSPSAKMDNADSTKAVQPADYYTCSMHRQVHLDKPGVCPICGMELVRASNGRKMTMGESDARVPLNDREQVLANVATVRVGYEEIEPTVRALGNLTIPDQNKTLITARFSGRIENLHVASVGQHVKAGDPLFDIYSPDIIQAENEYIQAHSPASPLSGNLAMMKAKLRLLGLTDHQIQSLESSVSSPLVLTYMSPSSGVVISKEIVKGSYVSEGVTLYQISDFSTLWDEAEVYEADARMISVGERANVTTASYPNELFSGTVSLVYPVVNAETRTVKVRVVVNNAAGKLKPNMYTETLFRKSRGRALTVPVGAVLVTGKRNLVYVKADHEDHFQAREVSLGSRIEGKYEIVSGLSEGEVVVSEGGYLIDSESQLKSGTGATHQHGTPAVSGDPAKEAVPEHHH